MQVEFIRETYVKGQRVNRGDIMDLPADEAKKLQLMNRIRPLPELPFATGGLTTKNAAALLSADAAQDDDTAPEPETAPESTPEPETNEPEDSDDDTEEETDTETPAEENKKPAAAKPKQITKPAAKPRKR